ncbi:unnamed protein product [Clonostachys rhizophaga]|uniref:Uncharacterized protein n=1 Tax=Clonostachys rhizophaga TaxID=160324 RepID=A0A9N9YFQ4_9HYPO|nr:unnamed protein product [Clonostachys rhizophaga]
MGDYRRAPGSLAALREERSEERYPNSTAMTPYAPSPVSTSPSVEGFSTMTHPDPNQPQKPQSLHENSSHASEDDSEDGSWLCHCTPGCKTGAGPRKAISHFFGRNKACTLLIPNNVWVFFCRKHYQRTRYRNGGLYAKTQIKLVREQATRIQNWSQKNIAKGRPTYLKDWTFALRKREQERVDEALMAQGAPGNGAELDDTDTVADIPRWVINNLGVGKTSDQVFELINRFRDELEAGRIDDLPEVEFLPNIVGGNRTAPGATARARNQAKRKASEAGDLSIGHNEGSTSAYKRARTFSGEREAEPPMSLQTNTSFILPSQSSLAVAAPTLPSRVGDQYLSRGLLSMVNLWGRMFHPGPPDGNSNLPVHTPLQVSKAPLASLHAHTWPSTITRGIAHIVLQAKEPRRLISTIMEVHLNILKATASAQKLQACSFARPLAYQGERTFIMNL